jgi:NADPH:quinone reductase-like Zn-dependent oxidoreductase
MRAVVHERYGAPEVLRVQEVERPVPKDDEILVKVHATTVTRTDVAIRAAKPWLWRFFAGLLRPRRQILGIEFAGEVVEVGAMVSEFKIGDHVFGLSAGNFGANAEYVSVRERAPVAHKPPQMSFEDAAAVVDGFYQATALQDIGLMKGQRILIYGATGSLGTAAVQLAREIGAHVTAVGNTKNVDLVRSLGADEVIDHLKEDFTKNGQTYDVILDATGKLPYRRSRRSVAAGGLFVPTDGLRNILLALVNKKVKFNVARVSKKHVLYLKELIEGGKYRAVIDRIYRLEDVVEATRYVETGQKTGNVVLQV